jgi:hypothetical protein
VTKSKTTDTTLWDVPFLQGAFKNDAVPIIWAGAPWWQIGDDLGSQSMRCRSRASRKAWAIRTTTMRPSTAITTSTA